MLKLLFLLPIVALLDPLLLYFLWPHLSVWSQIFGLMIYPLLFTFFVQRNNADGDVLIKSMRFLARLAAWYPGPISKLLAFVVALPPVENAIRRRVFKAVASNFVPGASQISPEDMERMARGETAVRRDEHGLKEARGRVVE